MLLTREVFLSPLKWRTVSGPASAERHRVGCEQQGMPGETHTGAAQLWVCRRAAPPGIRVYAERARTRVGQWRRKTIMECLQSELLNVE